MRVMRPIDHEARLSIVDHLDELRNRLIVCAIAFVAAFSLCYWQNSTVLDIVNRPLEESQRPGTGKDPLEQTAQFDRALENMMRRLRPALTDTGAALGALESDSDLPKATRERLGEAATSLGAVARELENTIAQAPEIRGRRPVTLGVAEPFLATFTVAGYAALLLSLPLILWQAYAFLLPAFDRRERRIALPLMAMVPLLFIAGVLFAHQVALPRAVDFLQNFNDDEFDILIQAKDYYRFVVLFMALMGLVFQIPVGVLALTRTGVVTARGLWERQGYVILGISIVAAVATPTPDPVTMLITMAPLVVLYWLSIGLAWIFRPRGGSLRGRWDEAWDEDEDEDEDGDEEEHLEADAQGDSARVS